VILVSGRPPPCLACPEPDIIVGGWGPDFQEAASVFAPFASPYWHTSFLKSRWLDRLALASRVNGVARARAFAKLDFDVMSTDPPVAPIIALNARLLISGRTHCLVWNLYYGVDLAAACVK
jgi:hypothetical protein